MQNLTPFNVFLSILTEQEPVASAYIEGNSNHPNLYGLISFYDTPFNGIIVNAQVNGLPDMELSNSTGFYGLHIHEFGDCTPPFDKTGNHYNPNNSIHPKHAGDMPPLLANNGYAWMAFFTQRFSITEVIGKSVVIHDMRDDFTTQPSGSSGNKIGCGVIRSHSAFNNFKTYNE